MIADAESALDGDLIKLHDDSAVYFVEAGTARLVPCEAIFRERRFSFKRVRAISDEQFAPLASGTPLTYPDGTLVKGESSAVYVISDGRKRPIASAKDFEALLYAWDNVVYVPESLLAQIELASPVRLVQGGVSIASN